jgi:hypothetical protein
MTEGVSCTYSGFPAARLYNAKPPAALIRSWEEFLNDYRNNLIVFSIIAFGNLYPAIEHTKIPFVKYKEARRPSLLSESQQTFVRNAKHQTHQASLLQKK